MYLAHIKLERVFCKTEHDTYNQRGLQVNNFNTQPNLRVNKKNKVKWAACALAGVIAASAFSLAFGQEQDSSGEEDGSARLEEVMVTARKRTESMYDVPISITVVNEEFIQNLGAQDFTALIPNIASLNAYQNGPGRTRLYIRGIANGAGNDNDTQNGETVAIYLDEIPISLGAMNPEIGLFDLERVEVLRGPQGTLYGAGSMAGTIRQVSRKPNLSEVEGVFEAGVSDIAHGSSGYTIKGLINAPVVEDKFAVRASAYYNDFGGYLHNILTGQSDINDGTSNGAKLSARGLIGENFIVDFSYFYHDYSDNGRPE